MKRAGIYFGAAVLGAIAGLTVGAPGRPGAGLLLFVAILAVALTLGRYLSRESPLRDPVLGMLVGLSVLALAWQGVQGPLSVPVSDFPFLIAMPLIVLGIMQRQLPLVVPSWLLVVAGGLAVGALLAALFVPNPPGFVVGYANGAKTGAAASRQTDLAFFLRTIYAMVLFPVLLAAVTASWARIRLFADLWVASTVICALAACLDSYANAGIADALVAGPFTHARAVGLTDQPNYLGQFVSMALPVAIVRAYQTRGLARTSTVAGIGVMILALQLSGSRLGLLGAVAGVVVLAALAPRIRFGLLVGSVVLVTLGVASLVYQPAGESALERFTAGGTTSENLRRSTIERSWAIAEDHLATGVGFSRVLDSHSLPIQFLMAGGVIALAAFGLWVWQICGLGIAMALGQRAPPDGAELAAAFAAGLVAWLVPGLVNPQLLERFMYVPAGLLLAMGYCLVRSRTAVTPDKPSLELPWSGRAPSVEPGPAGAVNLFKNRSG